MEVEDNLFAPSASFRYRHSFRSFVNAPFTLEVFFNSPYSLRIYGSLYPDSLKPISFCDTTGTD